MLLPYVGPHVHDSGPLFMHDCPECGSTVMDAFRLCYPGWLDGYKYYVWFCNNDDCDWMSQQHEPVKFEEYIETYRDELEAHLDWLNGIIDTGRAVGFRPYAYLERRAEDLELVLGYAV